MNKDSMNTTELTEQAEIGQPEYNSRRKMMTRLMSGAIIAAAGVGLAKAAQAQTVTDADVLNFALNLEYLEAEYYSLAVTGRTLDQNGVGINGTGTQGNVVFKANPQVTFTNDSLRQFANELYIDERNHVVFLRTALGGAAVARPQIDLLNSFNAAAQAAGIGGAFDPFASEVNFLLGSFVFEDVGVTAYKGAARLIQNPDFLEAAAGILAVEAYHAGSIRTRAFLQSQTTPEVADLVQKISDLRDGGGANAGPAGKDQGVIQGGVANIVPTDNNALAFSRTTNEVLQVVYLNAARTPGGFFPAGMNGTIK